MQLVDSLLATEGSCEALESLDFRADAEQGIGTTDDDLARLFPHCPNLHTAKLAGIDDLSDRTLVILAQITNNLRYIDISGCRQLTDIGVLELASQANRLEVVKLNGIPGLTDPSISALVRSLPRLAELDAADLPLLTSHSVRDIWTFGKKLRKVRLCRCSHLDDKGFPIPFGPLPSTLSPKTLHVPVIPGQFLQQLGLDIIQGEETALAEFSSTSNRASSWLEAIPPLILPAHHTLEHLHTLDLTQCKRITDAAVGGIVTHAPRLQHVHLAGCLLLTNSALERLCTLATHLETLTISHAEKITDPAIMDLVRSCPRLSVIDVSCKLVASLSC